MSNEELAALAGAGDEDAFDELVTKNLPLVRSVALSFSNRAELDDLIQVGAIGLIKAVRAFDPGRGNRLTTYAVPMIAGEIRRFLRDGGMIRAPRRKRFAARIVSLSEQDLSGLTRADLIPDPKCVENTAVDRAMVSALVGSLEGRERRLILLRFFSDLTQSETAKKLGTSQASVSRLEKRILNKLRLKAGLSA